MSLQDALVSAFGGSSADSETVGLVEQIISNEAAGKTGVPDLPSLPFFGGGGRSTGGWGISILNPYLRAFVFQQEYPITFPLVALGIGFLSIYGLSKLIGD